MELGNTGYHADAASTGGFLLKCVESKRGGTYDETASHSLGESKNTRETYAAWGAKRTELAGRGVWVADQDRTRD